MGSLDAPIFPGQEGLPSRPHHVGKEQEEVKIRCRARSALEGGELTLDRRGPGPLLTTLWGAVAYMTRKAMFASFPLASNSRTCI